MFPDWRELDSTHRMYLLDTRTVKRRICLARLIAILKWLLNSKGG